MDQIVYLHGKPLKLTAAQLIQSGGEGMVFQHGSTAVKLYHQPTPQHQTKLAHLLQSGLAQRLPTAVFTPTAPITNERGNWIGLQMPLLPSGALPLKRLSNPQLRQQHAITLPQIVTLLQHVHQTLTALHQQHVIVGDLNDTNLFLHSAATTAQSAWIDVDSYQFGSFACPVAMLTFLDPALYGVSHFAAQPVFTPATDWYAYTVLLLKSLLGVHPYGGAHPQAKTLQSRAEQRIAVWEAGVTYPQNALPLDTLSDELRHHLHRVFTLGERPLFPAHLLHHALRTGHPAPHRQPSAQPIDATKWLQSNDDVVLEMALIGGRKLLVIRNLADDTAVYRAIWLGAGGLVREMALFNGRTGYQFAGFGQHYLAVSPPHTTQLLILDISGATPQRVTLLESATFRETAVFAATPRHLYRIAGRCIMRGAVRDGLYLEEVAATAHHNQTWFCAAPHREAIAGYHRVFADYRVFVQTEEWGSFDLALPALAPHEYIADLTMQFGSDTVRVLRQVGHNGRFHTIADIFTLNGRWLQTEPVST